MSGVNSLVYGYRPDYLTDLFIACLVASGTRAEDSDRAFKTFLQILLAGRAERDEIRDLLEAAPVVKDCLAEHFGLNDPTEVLGLSPIYAEDLCSALSARAAFLLSQSGDARSGGFR